MPGARATKTSSTDTSIISAGTADQSGSHEPSMDEILASIRQIISDQNDEADRASVKAVEEVANPLPTKNNIDSIIGSVAADHWSDEEASPETGNETGNVAHSMAQSGIDQRTNDREKMAARVKSVTAARPARKPRPAPVSLDDLVEPAAPKSRPSVAPKAPPRPPSVQRLDPPVRQSRRTDVETPVAGDRKWQNAPISAAPAASTPAAPISAANSPLNQPRQIPAADSALERMIARRSARSAEAPIVQKPLTAEMPSSPARQKLPDAKQPVMRKAASATLPPSAVVPARPLEKPVVAGPDALAAKLPDKQIAKAAASVSEQLAITNPPVAQPGLLSPGADKSVNASFERLAVSMLEDRKEEMDLMMVDIMRPMLQEWLEDNLPSLVERLVREEIERVSRGVH